MRTLIKNVTAVTGNGRWQGSILLDGAIIGDIDPAAHVRVDEVVEGRGLYLIPGVIDDQVHFREPGLTHKEDLSHATRACAKGGVTTFLEMPNTSPAATTQARIDEKLQIAAQKSLVHYGFYIGATPHNLADLKSARRTPGIKIFMGSSTGDLLVDDQDALERIFAETTLPICAHCEDETIVRENAKRYAGSQDVADHSRVRDHRAAEVATRRGMDLARRHRHLFHVLHVSTANEVELLKDHANLVTSEVCPHHLLFDTSDYDRLGSRIKMNPSIKDRSDVEALWQALREGTIPVIATDHAPHTLEEKNLPYPDCPSGLPAVENSLALMLTEMRSGRCSLEQIVHAMCEAPAMVWNIRNKGRIERGFDADLVLIDLERRATIRDDEQQTKSRWSPWHGVETVGGPIRTWVHGQTVYRNESGREWFAEKPCGAAATFDPQLGGYWRQHHARRASSIVAG
jgi:dihydroorotase